MRADVVIGTGFGDEGKGRMTDYFAAMSGRECLVVRFNGGAQAGHTVVTPDGKRHVFGHVGAGAFVGASTYLSRFFVVNPILFNKELDRLAKLGVKPELYVDMECLVTTPYDMLLNQVAERARGDGRHGSCGVGFNETIERSRQFDYRITVGDLQYNYPRILEQIRDEYVPKRLHQLGIVLQDSEERILRSIPVFNRFQGDCNQMMETVITTDRYLLKKFDHLVFEGAQGLLLDEEHRFFPHVTRSKTGLRNVVTLAKEVGIDKLNVTYATRSYLTRHGAGPLPNELPGKPYERVKDPTNTPNEYQGSLRFAYLDLDLLQEVIQTDLKEADGLSVEAQLAVSCMDQIGMADGRFIHYGKLCSIPRTQFVPYLFGMLGMEGLVGYGPTREHCLPAYEKV